jgi:N-acetylmuramoyl-L-alanine amidase
MRLLNNLIEWFLDLFRKRPNQIPPVNQTPVIEAVKPTIAPEIKVWESGWYAHAESMPMHPGRVGDLIKPFAVVLHTTDMLPISFSGLLRNWTMSSGQGNGAHFGIDRSGKIYQFCSIFRNANHAGGKVHGVYRDAGKSTYHPNHCSVGIEIHAAGQVRLIEKEWFYQDGERMTKMPKSEITVDKTRKTRGWHGPTPAQMKALDMLLFQLEFVLSPAPKGLTVEPTAVVPDYGKVSDARIVGHVTLDPKRKNDPGPLVMDWLAKRSVGAL